MKRKYTKMQLSYWCIFAGAVILSTIGNSTDNKIIFYIAGFLFVLDFVLFCIDHAKELRSKKNADNESVSGGHAGKVEKIAFAIAIISGLFAVISHICGAENAASIFVGMAGTACLVAGFSSLRLNAIHEIKE
jgi:hypothetical protein